jgi:hypothetical protein
VRRLLAAAAVAAALVPAAPAAGASLGALDGDPLDRAAAMALPAIYRVDSEVAFDGLVDEDGAPFPVPPRALRLREIGTAFGAGRGGHIVAAAHVALPSDLNLALGALRLKDADRGVERTSRELQKEIKDRGLRPVRVRRIGLVVRQADAGAGGGRRYRASLVRVDRAADLALIRLSGAATAPVLPVLASVSEGTPVVTLGFGTGVTFTTAAEQGPVPAVRQGRLGATVKAGPGGAVPGKLVTRVDTLVRDGDSGGPVVDDAGRVRGVILLTDTRSGGGLIMPSREVSRLVRDAGVDPEPGAGDDTYRQGLRELWALDFPAARRSFAAAAKAFPAHTLAGALAKRATALETAEFRVAGERRPQAFLLALGIVSAIAALACALALAAPAIGRAYRPDR